MNEFIEKLEREYNYAKEEGRNEETGKYLLELVKIIEKDNPDVSCTIVKGIISKMEKALVSGVFIPLTLNEGEFKFVRPGLSINRRNSNIKMDADGIYYSSAFKNKPIGKYDSFTGKYIEDRDFQNLNFLNEDRIYIKCRNTITPYYFTKAYVWDKTIRKHNFIPSSHIVLNTYILINKDKCITTVDYFSAGFKTLNRCYKLNFKIDEEQREILEQFGVNFNFKIYDIHTT